MFIYTNTFMVKIKGFKKKQTQKAAVTVIQNAVKAKQRKKTTTITKLDNKVKRLSIDQRGSLQIDRQVLRWQPLDPPQQASPYYFEPNQPSNIRPICFLHQAISPLSRAYTSRYLQPVAPATNPTLPSTEAGIWSSQPYPLTASAGANLDPGQYGRNDQLQFQGSQTLGVSNDYTHLSTLYQVQCKAVNCRGYIDVFHVHPKKSYIRSIQQDISLPLGLSGFSFMSLGTNNMYSINNMYYSCKRIRRKYFNTTAPQGAPPTEAYLNTNPDLDMQFTIKNRKSRQRIKAPEFATGAVLDSTDIPLAKQDWIIISTTLDNKDVSANNHVKLQIWRTPVWRDREGAST